ncbi:MAG: 30S ribosomal protein S17 [Bacilli bacterium]|nr:30S ribosomal protein S17 [Bacilli bacterium]
MMERNNRKTYVGKVVSDIENKTIKVSVTTYKRHPLYGKRIKFTKKLTAHDENNEAKIGDVVRIMETRPLSKTKHFRLLEILEHGNNA